MEQPAVPLAAERPAARRFAQATAAIHARLPGPLGRLPQTFIGFALINFPAFLIDMALLWLTHGVWGLAYPLAVTVSYGAASAFAFVLNKVLNFRSHGHLGQESGEYGLVVVSNYLIWILGFSWLLEAVGVHYQIARVVSAAIEGIYVYLLARFWVFRHR